MTSQTLYCQIPNENDVLLMFQTIARQVFYYQQSRIVSMKECSNDEEAMDDDCLNNDSDDVLLRVCGAQLHKMISVRKEKLKRNKMTQEHDFLAQISMDASQKESLPVSLKSTELGGRVFPLIELIPFINQIVHSVRQEINEDSLKRYGDCFR